MELKFGKATINFNIADNSLLGILKPTTDPVLPVDTLLKESVMNPIGKPHLKDVLRKNKPSDLVILVSDISRSIVNYPEILQFLVEEIIDAGIDEKNIEFVIALGTHRQHTPEENEYLYGNLIHDFRFTFHDCYNNLTSIGETSTGLDVQVNKRVWNADFVIATGRINLHYLAGFSGGRKSVMPGISSYDTIRKNHSKLKRDGVIIGKTSGNPIAGEMDEAGRLFGIDYLLNVVETPQRETERVFWGDATHAFEEGLRFFKKHRTVRVARKAQCSIVSAGGYPNDRDFFLGHKALNTSLHIIEPHGSLILAAQCSEGFGHERFFTYLTQHTVDELLAYPEKKIQVGGHRAFFTATMLKNHTIYVLSDLDAATLTKMSFIPITTLDEGISLAKKNHGERFTTYVVPDGKVVLPVSQKK
jgi:nickel-dependent lactate racemase